MLHMMNKCMLLIIRNISIETHYYITHCYRIANQGYIINTETGQHYNTTSLVQHLKNISILSCIRPDQRVQQNLLSHGSQYISVRVSCKVKISSFVKELKKLHLNAIVTFSHKKYYAI